MLTLDAWLECPSPRVRILDRDSRRVVAEWQGRELADLMESGRLCPEDCRGRPGADAEHEIIRELLLESCLGDLTVARRTAAPVGGAPDCHKRPVGKPALRCVHSTRRNQRELEQHHEHGRIRDLPLGR
ncbi:hypothetical protein [Thioalkalivibrio sp. ALE18]|nr:hypothetical protein [Thioalkalivibrio sp. ALE18]